jgi:5-methylcytosine-specific restriction protein B
MRSVYHKTSGLSSVFNVLRVFQQALNSIIDYEIVPLLNEYWFDETAKIKDWTQKLKGAIK